MATYDKEWIIRYIDGELSPAELGPFEAAMQTDAGLAAEVALYRELKAVLGQRLPEDPAREALTQRTNQLNQQYFGQDTSSTTPVQKITVPRSLKTVATLRSPKTAATLRWLTTVAAVASILVAVLLLWPADYSRKLDQLGQTDMIGITERGDQTDTLLQKASIFFNQKQFEKALPLLNQAVANDSSSQLALFYRGIAAWHSGDLRLARTSLEQVYNNASLLKNQAAFYMALTYAGEKNKSKTLEWLHTIPTTDAMHLKVNELEKIIR